MSLWSPYPSESPRKRFGYHIKSKFGISLDEYEALFESAGHACQICKRPVSIGGKGEGRGSMATGCLDHCHSTGKIRGVLCRICNSFLGVIKDDVSKVKDYMEAR